MLKVKFSYANFVSMSNKNAQPPFCLGPLHMLCYLYLCTWIDYHWWSYVALALALHKPFVSNVSKSYFLWMKIFQNVNVIISECATSLICTLLPSCFSSLEGKICVFTWWTVNGWRWYSPAARSLPGCFSCTCCRSIASKTCTNHSNSSCKKFVWTINFIPKRLKKWVSSTDELVFCFTVGSLSCATLTAFCQWWGWFCWTFWVLCKMLGRIYCKNKKQLLG